MSKENFEKQIRKRMEQLDEINKHGIFKELKGTVTDFNYDTKSLTMTFEATKFHENALASFSPVNNLITILTNVLTCTILIIAKLNVIAK